MYLWAGDKAFLAGLLCLYLFSDIVLPLLPVVGPTCPPAHWDDSVAPVRAVMAAFCKHVVVAVVCVRCAFFSSRPLTRALSLHHPQAAKAALPPALAHLGVRRHRDVPLLGARLQAAREEAVRDRLVPALAQGTGGGEASGSRRDAPSLAV